MFQNRLRRFLDGCSLSVESVELSIYKQVHGGEERRFSMPEAASINGSSRRCRGLFFFPLCSSLKMPSSSEIFHFPPNFDARVQSTAFLHRQF